MPSEPLVTKLTDATIELDQPRWRREQREVALRTFREGGLPDPADDVWRYAPLEKLALEDVELAGAAGDRRETAIGGRRPACVVTVSAGLVTHVELSAPSGLTVTTDAGPELLGTLVGADDAFASLNLALTPGPVFIEVAPNAQLDGPVVLLVDCPAGASFPRVLVRVGTDARVRILEHLTGPDATLVAGVSEYHVATGASLEVCTVQSLGDVAWSVLRTRAQLGRDAAISQTVVGLGARYDRVRADAILDGEGSASTLHTAHVGTGDQVHDLRTMQVHVGARTTSRLFSKAAVCDAAESIYSGLIAMRRGSKRADARQVNHSLVLSEGARADAVPNLDIEENDVRCAHASSVGPVDEEQRWYLESRGVEPRDAVQLIIEGFFSEVESLLDDAVLGAQLRDAIAMLDIPAPGAAVTERSA
jgi:Fe-S cluster assembly protein SufD